MIQRLPGAVIFIQIPVLQSNSANTLWAFAPVFASSEWEYRVFSIFCMWKSVCAIIGSVVWKYTAALRYKQAVVQAEKVAVNQHWESNAALRNCSSVFWKRKKKERNTQTILYSACYWESFCPWIQCQGIVCMHKCMHKCVQLFFCMITPPLIFHLFQHPDAEQTLFKC